MESLSNESSTGDKSNKLSGINFSSSSKELTLSWEILVDDSSERGVSIFSISESSSLENSSWAINNVWLK